MANDAAARAELGPARRAAHQPGRACWGVSEGGGGWGVQGMGLECLSCGLMTEGPDRQLNAPVQVDGAGPDRRIRRFLLPPWRANFQKEKRTESANRAPRGTLPALE